MYDDNALDTLRRLKAHNARVQRWVWDCATILHDAGWETAACFEAALDALEGDPEDFTCDACHRSATYPQDHEEGCPLANNDDPAYAAHIILTEPPEAPNYLDERSSPAGWGHP